MKKSNSNWSTREVIHFFFEKDNSNIYNDRSNSARNNDKSKTKYNIKLKSRKCPPQMQGIKKFENGLIKIIENIQFRTVSNEFFKKMKEDIKTIWSSKNMFVPADKLKTLSIINRKYNKILQDSVTKNNENVAPSPLPKKIYMKAKKIAKLR